MVYSKKPARMIDRIRIFPLQNLHALWVDYFGAVNSFRTFVKVFWISLGEYMGHMEKHMQRYVFSFVVIEYVIE